MSKTLFCWLKQYKCDFKDTDMFCNFIVCLKDDMCSYHWVCDDLWSMLSELSKQQRNWAYEKEY